MQVAGEDDVSIPVCPGARLMDHIDGEGICLRDFRRVCPACPPVIDSDKHEFRSPEIQQFILILHHMDTGTFEGCGDICCICKVNQRVVLQHGDVVPVHREICFLHRKHLGRSVQPVDTGLVIMIAEDGIDRRINLGPYVLICEIILVTGHKIPPDKDHRGIKGIDLLCHRIHKCQIPAFQVWICNKDDIIGCPFHLNDRNSCRLGFIYHVSPHARKEDETKYCSVDMWCKFLEPVFHEIHTDLWSKNIKHSVSYPPGSSTNHYQERQTNT